MLAHRVFVAALLAASAAVASAQSVPVTKFTLRSSSVVKSDDKTVAAMNDSSKWTLAVAVASDKRGRMDVVDGFGDEFKKGDYLLFDSTESILVRPATKQFFLFGHFDIPELAEMPELAELGAMPNIPKPTMKTTYATDSLGAGGTIDGRATQLWRLTESRSITFNAKDLPPGLEMPAMDMKTVTQFWYADAPSLPRVPYVADDVPIMPDSMLKQMTPESRAALRRLPKGKLIARSRSAMTQSGMQFMPGWSAESVTEVAGVGQANVAASTFVLPNDYLEIATPQMEGMPVKKAPGDHGAKWRAKRAP